MPSGSWAVGGSRKRTIALEQSFVQLIGTFQRRSQHGRAYAVKLAAARVKHQQPLRGKNPGIEGRESLREGVAGLVSLSQRIHGV
jgi:hypothetical protein